MYSRHIFIKTNQSCNMNCVYCYEKKKSDMVFDEEKTFIKLIDVLKKTTSMGTKIKLIGGEPFLVYDKLRRLCDFIWNEKFTERIHFQITTNGTLVHGNVQEWLMKHKADIDCKLSLDGNRTSQDINRPNSFDKIDIPFFSKTWQNCTINMVVTPQTMPFFAENVIFLHQCGFSNIVPIFAVLVKWSDCNLQRTYYEQLSRLATYYLNNPYVQKCRTLSIPIENTLTKCDTIICDIGKKIIYDVESEDFYPCHLFFPSVCGDNHPQKMNCLDFSRRSMFEIAPCNTCKFINICHTCYAANYIERGDLGKRNMSLCEFHKIGFFVYAKMEYNRIINSDNTTKRDYLTMKAIHELHDELEVIGRKYDV